MGLPAKRRTKQSKRERASHFALKAVHLIVCEHCKKKIVPHRTCRFCGYYHGRQVIVVETLVNRRKRREDRYDKKRNA